MDPINGSAFIEYCIRNVRANAQETQSWLAPRLTGAPGNGLCFLGWKSEELEFHKFVTESRWDGARILFMLQAIAPDALQPGTQHDSEIPNFCPLRMAAEMQASAGEPLLFTRQTTA